MRNRIGLLLLRVSLGVVFLLFGIGKFRGDIWAQTMRSMDFFQRLPWNVDTSIMLTGTIEVIIGICLIIGFLSRYAAVAAVLMLISIIWLLQFQEIRDFGLLGVAVCLMITSELSWGMDLFIQAKKQRVKI